MAYFDQSFLDFFIDLRQNNNREWFHANKKRYEYDVKEPFKLFVQEMINRLSQVDDRIGQLQPKNCIFRIYRDTRFSKDKTPYKYFTSAAIAPGGKKDMENPGLYFQLSDKGLEIFSGVYMPEKESLWRIRFAISRQGEAFRKALNFPAFKELFGELRGDKNKRLPPEFKEPAEKEPLLFHKQFYYQNELPPAVILTDELPEILMDHYQACLPLNLFFQKAMRGEE